MDPLSAAASVIAVATIAAQVCTAFADLHRDFAELPGRLHALSNEVADINFVLHQVAVGLRERNSLSDGDIDSIPPLLAQAAGKLEELKEIIGHLSKTCTSRRVLLRASVWRKWHPKLQGLQADIRTIKCSLNVLLGASNSRDLIRVRLDLEDLSRTSSHEAEDQADFRLTFSQDLAQHHTNLAQTVDESIQTVDQRLIKIEQLLMAQAVGIDESQFVGNKPSNRYTAVAIRRQARNNLEPAYDTNPAAASPAIGIRVRKSIGPGCRLGCPCICHCERKSQTSSYLDGVVGRLFWGYSGLPLLNSRCDSTACQKSQAPSVSAEYWFPLGFCWSQIVRLQISYKSRIGPQWELTSLRRVPDSAQCVKYSLEGDINGLKALFQHGLASPKDVSTTRGYSLLRWALYGQQYETCRFLLAAGADPDYKPVAVTDDCPADKACDVLLRGGLSAEVVEILRCISRDSEFIESQEFSSIHNIVLGLSLKDLETAIVRNSGSIDARDAMGRTALEWASARGDDRAVVTLLSFGAEPNVMDKKLNTPLTLASNQGHTVCARLLLEAGALADPVLPAGVKFGSPLNCASRNATDPLLIKTLLDFDADVEASGVDGVTPLLHAARSKPVSFAKLLLDYGADINASSKDGRTALTTAIIHNNHNVLTLLLERWYEYTECPRLKGPHLLDLVIEHADVETMSILTTAEHLQFRGDSTYVLQRFAPQLSKRLDLTDTMSAAFGRLLEAIREGSKLNKNAKIHTTSVTPEIEKDPECASEEDLESVEEFEDAQESFVLASDDLTTVIRHRSNPTRLTAIGNEESQFKQG